MRRILVTGGAGFIGTNLVHYYLERGDEVHVFDGLTRPGCFENLEWLRARNGRSLKVHVGDLRRPPPFLSAVVEESDAVFHFAGQVAVTTSVENPAYDFEVNAGGTFHLLELIRRSQGKKPAFFYASTNKVYGGMEDLVIDELPERYAYRDHPDGISECRGLDFHSPYGCSKGTADQYVRDYARIYGLQTVVFRQSCIYGYRQFGLEDQGWVAWFIIAATLGRPITIFGDGKQVRDVLFIDDLVAAYDRAWQRIETTSGGVYNIGGGPTNTISLLDLLHVLRREIDPSLKVSYADWRPGDQPVYISDIGKAERDFDWRPEVGWEEGAARLICWVSKNRPMLERMLGS